MSAVCLSLCAALLFQEIARYRFARRVSEEVLRFHVIANSDTAEDQALKLSVRDALIAYMADFRGQFDSADEAAAFAAAHCDKLAEIASAVIEQNGYSYPVDARVTESRFPERTYGGFTFPAGVYTALRVEIGRAAGHNWWCVLYPPLCFTEEGDAMVPASSEDALRESLSARDYARLTQPRPQLRLWLWDMLFGR